MMSDDVVEFLRSRPIAMLGTRDTAHRPYCHESLLVAIEPDHVDLLVFAHLARGLLENVADNGRASLLISRAPGDHRSVQAKGRLGEIDPARPRPELVKTWANARGIYSKFVPPGLVDRFVLGMERQPALCARLVVEEVYDQTPGQGAGRRLGGAP